MEITASAELSAKFQRLSGAFKIICVSLIPVFYPMCFRKGKWGSGMRLQKWCKLVRYVLIRWAAVLNPPGTGAEGTATGTSSISCYFPPLLQSTHRAGWSHFGFRIVPDCTDWGLEACAGTSTSTDRGMVVLDLRDGFSTPSATPCSNRFLKVSAASRAAVERCIELPFHSKYPATVKWQMTSKKQPSVRLVHAKSH